MDQLLIKTRLALGYEMFPERKYPTKDTLDHLVAQITEEMGELRGAIRSYLGRPFSPEKKASFVDVTEEFGDVLGTLLVLGDSFSIRSDEALRLAIEKMQKRRDAISASKINSAQIIDKDTLTGVCRDQ